MRGQSTIEYLLALLLGLGCAALLAAPPVWRALRHVHHDIMRRVSRAGVATLLHSTGGDHVTTSRTPS